MGGHLEVNMKQTAFSFPLQCGQNALSHQQKADYTREIICLFSENHSTHLKINKEKTFIIV